ncbi:MAG: hypothetical protein WCG20_02510 [bacterium]
MDHLNPFKKITSKLPNLENKTGLLAAALLTLTTLTTTLESCNSKKDPSFKPAIEKMTDNERAEYAKSVYHLYDTLPQLTTEAEVFESGVKNQTIDFESGEAKMITDPSGGRTFIIEEYDTIIKGSDGYDDYKGKEFWLFDKNGDGVIDGFQESRMAEDNYAPDDQGVHSTKTVFHGPKNGHIYVNPSIGDTISEQDKPVLDLANKVSFPNVIKLFEEHAKSQKN